MVPILHPLPLDLTGKALTNIFFSEEHSVADQADDPYKIVVLEKGYFYKHDLIVYDHLRKPLIPNVDYQITAIQPEIAKTTAFTACAVIVIKNPRITNKVFVSGRYVGGEYCMLTDAIIHAAQTLLLGGVRKVYWKNIKDKPNAFRPSGHQHLYWQLYKFTKPTATLKRIQVAQKIITGKDFTGLYDEWKSIYDEINQDLQALEDRLTIHIEDKMDPHRVTKLQVKLELVYNGYPATYDEARQGSGAVMDAYATPLRAKESIEFNFLPMLQTHLDDKANPHGVTYATLGTYNMQMLVDLANQFYTRGETTESSYRLGNRTWNQAKQEVQTGMYPSEIKFGLFDWTRFALMAPPAEHILTCASNGYMTWRPVRTMLNTYTKKGNKTFYISGAQSYSGSNWINLFNRWIGPQPENSIGILRSSYSHGTSAGNGGIWVVIPVNIIMRFINGSWNY